MQKILDIQQVIINQFEQADFYERECFSSITLDNQINGITGPRGIGKTSFLVKTAIERGAKTGHAIYFSMDNLYFLEHTLLDLIDQLYKETDVRTICIDEIQKYANWQQTLKNIFDIYSDLTIIFTGSSAVDIVQSTFDLSRRVSLYELHGFSFREYLAFYLRLERPMITWDDLLKQHQAFCQALNLPQVLKYFNDYLRMGYYPFFKKFSHDQEKFKAIENTSLKSVYEDIALFHSVKSNTLLTIERLFKFVLNSLPGEINANKLANSLQKDFDSVSLYLSYLEQAGLIRFLYPKKSGHAYLRNPAKMLPDNTNLIYAFDLPHLDDTLLGKLRETFIINQLQNAKHTPYYSQVGDVSVNERVFEVGGKNKSEIQLEKRDQNYFVLDGILVGAKQKIPLYLFGFLY